MWNELCEPSVDVYSSNTTHNTACNFGSSTRLGLAFVVQTAFASILAVAGLLSYITFSYVKKWVNWRRSRRLLNERYPFTWPSHLLFYLVALLLFDLIQALGTSLSIRWIADAGIQEGSYCTSQGILKQTGDLGSALTTLALTVHSFAVLFFRWKPSSSPFLAFLVLGTICLFITLTIALAYRFHQTEGYYGNTEYWCWITYSKFRWYGIGFEYMWMWLTALVNLLLYIPTVILYFGFLQQEEMFINGSPKRRYRFSWRASPGTDRRTGWILMLYPLVYIVTILPISIARFLQFVYEAEKSGKTIPFYATVIGAILLSSSGLINTILYSRTRTDLLFPSDSYLEKDGEIDTEVDEDLPQSFELHPLH
ncbi:hypothetical protein SISSUDRAFT_1055894 [Sistotremastrum suecicum HHB10207 ss-3]|uniref:G-protein coupled receptors family 1 profile domain-containing protein n=1 Tax=Sistotremastrum suecicum HHB10207 ss-3 TaxID=1314776 RepID=A0A165XGB8_9AGAM|nr:hypothetical protein SISSUDRAFT_1055894 [Sistotremastrum suecicum HHB10207 ss-3]